MQKILIIDDDAVLLERVQSAIRLKGFGTLTATSGRSGITLARRHVPVLVVCDVAMDDGDGYSTLSAIRRDPSTAAIPVILMTGHADYPGMRQGMDLGADDYLAKPFTTEALLASVEARLLKVSSFAHSSEQKLDELRAAITSIVPHELNTPLTSILEFTEILLARSRSQPPTEALEMLQHIHEAGRRLRQVIENNILCSQLLLETAASRRTDSIGANYTQNAAQLVVSLVRRFSHSRSRSIDCDRGSSDGIAAIAPEYLTKILEELLDNACKFSRPESPIEVYAEVSDGRFLLVITDHGRGMTAEQIANIGAFVQFDRAIHEQQGTGLGLAVVKRLVELHEGSLSISSELGGGTIVRISLPLGVPLNPSAPSDELSKAGECADSAKATCRITSDTPCPRS